MTNTQFTQSEVGAPHEPEVKIIERIVEVQRPVVVELTSKRFKGMILVANLMMCFSIFFFFFTFSQTAQSIFSTGTGVSIAFLIFAFSLVLYCTGKFLAWWNNG